jgi:hypothetical protein
MYLCIRWFCWRVVRPSVVSCCRHRCSSIVPQMPITNVSCSVRKSGKRARSCCVSWMYFVFFHTKTRRSCSVESSVRATSMTWIRRRLTSTTIPSGRWFMTSFLIKARTVSSSRHRPISARSSGLGARFERIAVFHTWISCMVSVTLKVVCMRRSRSRVVRRVDSVLSHTHDRFTDLVLPQASSNTCTITLCALQRVVCRHGRGHTNWMFCQPLK